MPISRASNSRLTPHDGLCVRAAQGAGEGRAGVLRCRTRQRRRVAGAFSGTDGEAAGWHAADLADATWPRRPEASISWPMRIKLSARYQGLVGCSPPELGQATREHTCLAISRPMLPPSTGSTTRPTRSRPSQSWARTCRTWPRRWPTDPMTCLLHPTQGFTKRAAISGEGVRTVLELRSEYGQPNKKLTDPAKYYDLTYYNKAVGPQN